MTETFAHRLQRSWWQPRTTPLARALAPLAALVARAARRRRAGAEGAPGRVAALAVPVIVVGNVIVGGAGKTPTVIALVALLRAWGRTPGIVTRGHGRSDDAPRLLDAATPPGAASPAVFGDEPVLMHRRTGAPVAVARARRDAALALLAAHPEVDVVIADDGLQHHALPRDIELVVFDGRGVGNGRVLPAGPLREPLDALWPRQAKPGVHTPWRFVLVNGRWPAPPALPMPATEGSCWEAARALGGAVALDDWARGVPADAATLAALRGRPVLAAAGIGDPERFFAMLESQGLRIRRLPLADHASLDPLPWDASEPDVVVTEKDAVKLAGRVPGRTRVWVATLDFALPDGLARALREALDAGPRRAALP
ncbi:MAG: tetraacyldisaccharide 4'-kinase [Burkholderiaceae bacterium]